MTTPLNLPHRHLVAVDEYLAAASREMRELLSDDRGDLVCADRVRFARFMVDLEVARGDVSRWKRAFGPKTGATP